MQIVARCILTEKVPYYKIWATSLSRRDFIWKKCDVCDAKIALTKMSVRKRKMHLNLRFLSLIITFTCIFSKKKLNIKFILIFDIICHFIVKSLLNKKFNWILNKCRPPIWLNIYENQTFLIISWEFKF